jgi:lipoprotein NlpD
MIQRLYCIVNTSLPRLAASLPSAFWACSLAALALAGCATSTHRAPVEERQPTAVSGSGSTLAPVVAGTAAGAASAAPGGSSAPGASVPSGATTAAVPAGVAVAASGAEAGAAARPGAENAGQPGFYTVKPGDTLVRIGLETGQNWRDIARWNSIDNPNVLEVGHVLRVAPPPSELGAATTRPVAPATRIESRPLDARPAGAPASAASAPAAASAGSPGAPGSSVTPLPPAATPSPAARDADSGDISWSWPASGPVTTGFDDVRSKGLAIAGKAGDPVLAAADGRVVYAGSGLRGYGNLVIVKHNATYLTAYAHNQTLLVKEDQAVRRGQKIAEMGSSDTDRVQLHFEVRRMGRPVDPAKVLPPR